MGSQSTRTGTQGSLNSSTPSPSAIVQHGPPHAHRTTWRSPVATTRPGPRFCDHKPAASRLGRFMARNARGAAGSGTRSPRPLSRLPGPSPAESYENVRSISAPSTESQQLTPTPRPLLPELRPFTCSSLSGPRGERAPTSPGHAPGSSRRRTPAGGSGLLRRPRPGRGALHWSAPSPRTTFAFNPLEVRFSLRFPLSTYRASAAHSNFHRGSSLQPGPSQPRSRTFQSC